MYHPGAQYSVGDQVHEPYLISQTHFKVSSCCVKPLSSATGHREGHRSSPVLERKHHLLFGVAGFFSQGSYSLKLGTIISEIIATQRIQEKKGH